MIKTHLKLLGLLIGSIAFNSHNLMAQEVNPAVQAPSSPANPMAKVNPPKKIDDQQIEADLNQLIKNNYESEGTSIFEGVVSVQNRARKKSGKFVFNPYYSMDFSDTPYTMWAPNFNLGYCLSEFTEVALNYSSGFSNSERFLAKKFKQLTLDGGGTAEVDIQKAKSQMGIELNWAPIYGKDSWGPYAVIRSDMFLSFAFYSINYETGKGNRIKFGIGKTFFIAKYFNLRLTASLNSVEYLSSTLAKDSSLVGYGDMGLIFYL